MYENIEQKFINSTTQLTLSGIFKSRQQEFYAIGIKVIIEKSRGEVSLVEKDTIGNVSWPIKNYVFFSLIL